MRLAECHQRDEMLELLRLENTGYATFGVLRYRGEIICMTLERPWKNNEPFVSCIPPDIYRMERVVSPKFGETFEVVGVPNRTKIAFHPANKPTEIQGCIAPGMWIGQVHGERAVLDSREAFRRFMKKMGDIKHQFLSVRRVT